MKKITLLFIASGINPPPSKAQPATGKPFVWGESQWGDGDWQ